MYEYIKGILTKITAKYIVVETAGIGYLLHVANPYAYSGKMNQEVQVYLHQVVREDAHLLWLCDRRRETALFELDHGIWNWPSLSSCYYRCR